MLHDLSSPSSDSIFKSWNTAVKLTWNVSRSTYTYLVENVLAEKFQTLRNQIISRYSTFFQNLLNSSSREVAFLANVVSCDCQTVTSRNIQLVKDASGYSPWDYSNWKVKSALKVKPVPKNQKWRPALLLKFLEKRRTDESLLLQTERLTMLINSLCDT